MMVYPEGEILRFHMTAEQRKIHTEYNAKQNHPRWDNVRIFRAHKAIRSTLPPKPPKAPPKELFRTCHCCGSKVKVKRSKVKSRPKALPLLRWWLDYGVTPEGIPQRTGGFRTLREARQWYLGFGR